jgi:hypothetical protein
MSITNLCEQIDNLSYFFGRTRFSQKPIADHELLSFGRILKVSMKSEKNIIRINKSRIWQEINAKTKLPSYPALVQELLITAQEAEYYDRNLAYDEQYREWLEMREGFIIDRLNEKTEIIGVDDYVILDIGKQNIIRAPMVIRGGVEIPMISYVGSRNQPKDYITYFDVVISLIDKYN